MRFNSIVTLVLFCTVVYTGWLAGWWAPMNGWTPAEWTIYTMSVLAAWIGSDEFGRVRGGG